MYSARKAFDFLLEFAADIETSPILPLDFTGFQEHCKSIIQLAIWKTVQNPKEVFLVVEDNNLKEKIKVFCDRNKLKINIINSKEALAIIK